MADSEVERDKQLTQEITENKTDEYLIRLKYLQADFDNYCKQFEKEKEAIMRLANEKLVRDLLVIADDLERAVLVAEHGKIKDGLELLSKNFMKILEKYGLQRIETVGKPFNPYVHEAIAQEQSSEPDGMILEELLSGYTLHGKVIRPAAVKIAGQHLQDGGLE
ncbi:MAG: nucleotide exchange factor GrpE [Candidatus Aenigmarchaeota archaeon]|nr:nucleotide exchange factor GrpE [Candidatus Aenigmarchaeota archaeon]